MPSDLPSFFRRDLLAGKAALVTGGGGDICGVMVEQMLNHGCKVAIASRNMENLTKRAEEFCKKTGGECIPVRVDIRNEKEIEAAVDTVIEKFGSLDILINGAAGNFLSPAGELSTNAFRTVMEIDAIGTFAASRIAYTKWMKKNGGSIINVTATLHWNGELLQVHPAAAKAAIEGMSKVLANEWGRHNVRVNNIAPVGFFFFVFFCRVSWRLLAISCVFPQ